MPDRDATRRDDIDKIKVPVNFSTFTADDGAFSVSVPGILHRRPESHGIDDSWQYADMSNGAYYMIGRVNTHSSFLGEKDETILKEDRQPPVREHSRQDPEEDGDHPQRL